MSFNELFGGLPIAPSQLSYLALTISASTELQWPMNQSGTDPVVSDIIDVNASSPGLNIDMPDATLVSTGTNVLFNNVGSQTVTIRDSTGGTIISLSSGTAWIVYLTDNQDPDGTWKTFQFGASVSVTNAAALAGAGLKAISTTLNTRIPSSSKGANYTITDTDRAVALIWTSGVGQFDLPAAGVVGSDWYTIVRNSGNGDLSVVPPAGTIDGAASKTFPAGSSSFIFTDGVNYYTLGFGSGSSGGGSGFGFTVINVAGSGDYTLSGAELGQVGYRFTGVLTGTRNIVVPGSTEEYWVDNQTSGAFSLFVKTAAQVPGVEVQQGSRTILYCDASNVYSAETTTVSFPISVANGGTGAINASSARTNLGAVATTRVIAAGAGLSGGGDLSTDRTLSVDTLAAGIGSFTINSRSVNYTFQLSDGGGVIVLHPSGGGAGDVFTIPANSVTAFPVGSVLNVVNRSTDDLTISINTDTLILAGTTVTGSLILGPNGMMSLTKIETTTWLAAGIYVGT